jgi:hypothetical protein
VLCSSSWPLLNYVPCRKAHLPPPVRETRSCTQTLPHARQWGNKRACDRGNFRRKQTWPAHNKEHRARPARNLGESRACSAGPGRWACSLCGAHRRVLVTDGDASLHLSNSPSTLYHFRDFSNYGLAGIGGAVGGLYFWGKATNDPHKQEAGILSGEGAVNALLSHGSPEVFARSRAPYC